MTGNQCCSDGTQAPNCCGSTALASGNQCCSDGTQGAGCTDATFRLVSGQSTYNGVPWFGLFLEGDCTSNCSDTRWWTGGICFPPGSTFSVLSFAVPVRQGAWAPDNTTSYTTLSGIPSDTLADFIGSNADAWFDLSVMQQPSQYPVSCDVSIHDYLTGGVTYLTISAP